MLARWGSWGATGVAEVFDETRAEYESDRAELRELLSESEYRAANRTVINAHYTDPALATELWQTLNTLGDRGGHGNKPSLGTPAARRRRSSLHHHEHSAIESSGCQQWCSSTGIVAAVVRLVSDITDWAPMKADVISVGDLQA